MPKLIDADKFIEHLKESMREMQTFEFIICVEAIINELAKAPTVEAIPVKYILGKIEWFKEAYEEYDGHWYKNCADALNELLDDWDTEGAFYEER